MYAVPSFHELHEGIEVVGRGGQLWQGDVQGAGLVDLTIDELRQQCHFFGAWSVQPHQFLGFRDHVISVLKQRWLCMTMLITTTTHRVWIEHDE